MLENNLIEIMKIDPILGTKIHSISTNQRFEVFIDEKDNANINIYDKKKDIVLYKDNPLKEVEDSYSQFTEKYSRYPYIFFYGVGNGVLLKLLLGLNSIKKIFVIEPNLELLYITLNLIDFTEEIKDNRIEFILEEDFDFKRLYGMLNNMDIKAWLRTYQLQINNNYYLELYKENIISINKKFTDMIKRIIIASGNDSNDSLIGLDHHLQNLSKMIDSYTLNNILKNRNSDNAVVVSTGPSLYKQLPLLKKFQKYLTILSVDASLPILQKEGIKPDFVFSMERVEATAKFFENLDKELLKDTLFIVSSVSHPQTIENLKDMKIAISQRPFGYIKMFKLNRWGNLGLGMSAANMAFDFAYISKFQNIALIGQDLAFAEDGKTHSKGAIYGENEEQYNTNTFFIKGFYGKKVKTSKVWDLFRGFFERDIPVAHKDNLKVYNCTEGGAYINGAEHISFEHFLTKIIETSNPKKEIKFEIIGETLKQHYKKRSKKLILLYIERLTCIKERVESVFLEVMKMIEELEELNKNNNLETLDDNRLLEVIAKIDTIKDILEDDRAIRKMTNITDPIILNQELLLAEIVVKEAKTDMDKKVKLVDWIYEHKSWLFFLAGGIENILFLMKKNIDKI